jgi:hypothetical protein
MRRPEEATVVMQARRDIEKPPAPVSRSEEATVLISRPTPHTAEPAPQRREEAGATRIMAAPAASAKAGSFPWKLAVAGAGVVVVLLGGGWWLVSSRPAKPLPVPSPPPAEVKPVQPSPAPAVAQTKNLEEEYERLNTEGIRLAQEGKMDEALSAFRRAVKVNPDGKASICGIPETRHERGSQGGVSEGDRDQPKNGTPYKYLANLFEAKATR